MRSDRVFDALQTLRNRYMLCQLASKATRKFHRPSTRIQETMNGVLDRIAGKERQEVLAEPENFAEAQRRAAETALATPLVPLYFYFVFFGFGCSLSPLPLKSPSDSNQYGFARRVVTL